MKFLNKTNVRKLKNLSKRYGLRELYNKIREKLSMPYQDYGKRVQEYLPGEMELEKQREEEKHLPYRPLVSIVVPTYETEETFLKQMIDSVISQTYTNWQLCLADGSTGDKVEEIVKKYYDKENRIVYRRLLHNGGISENTNQGFEMADGEYIALLDHDDLLVFSALFEMVKRINETKADMLYSDEDKISADSTQYMEPHFKLDYNEELLLGNNYICHFLMVSRELLQKAGNLDSRYDGAQDFDFVLRCSEYANRIEHISKILYHWRVHMGSTAGNTNSKLYAYEAGKKAIEAALKRRGYRGQVVMTKDLGFYRVQYEMPREFTIGIQEWGPEVSSFRKIRDMLETEIHKLGGKVVSNDTESTNVDYVLEMNRSITWLAAGSFEKLLGSCSRKGVRQVGGRVVRKGKVVNCGFFSKRGQLEPRFKDLPKGYHGYYNRAWLAVQVDALDKTFIITKTKESEGSVIVEPTVQVKVAN